MNLRNLFVFDEMLVPKFITVIYWVLLAASIGNAVTLMSLQDSWQVLMYRGIDLLRTLISIRLGSELVVAVFRMQSDLRRLANK